VLNDFAGHLILLFIMTFVSYLMVSRIPYIAVNKTTRKRGYKGILALTIISIGVLAVFHTIWVYLACAWVYVLYGLYNKFRQLVKSTQEKPLFARKRIKK
jgi:phosphatidylserine synthase